MKKNTFRWLMFGVLFTLLCNVISIAQSGNDPVRGQQLIELAKQALGGDAKLNEIQGIGLEGKINHPGQAQQEAEKLKLVFFSRTLDGNPGSVSEDIDVNVTVGEGDGDKKVIIRRGDSSEIRKIENGKVMVLAGEPDKDGNKTFQKRVIIINDKDGQQSEQSSSVEKDVVVNIVGANGAPGEGSCVAPPLDLGHSMIGLLLKSPLPLDVAYVGDGENGTADAVNIKTKDGFNGVLFLDKASHLPVALNYRSTQSPLMIRVKRGEKINPEQAQKLAESAKAQQAQEVTLRFSDRRVVDGVLLPYHITRTVNGELKDEYSIEKYDLNPNFKVMEHHRSK